MAFALLLGIYACSSDDAKEIEGIWTLSSFEEQTVTTNYLGGGVNVSTTQKYDLVDANRQWRFNLDPQTIDFAGFKEVSNERLELSNGDTLNYSFSVVERTLFNNSQSWELTDDQTMIIGTLPRQFEFNYEVTESELSLNISRNTANETHSVRYRFTR